LSLSVSWPHANVGRLAKPLSGSAPDYELIDVGDGRRLERFGERLVDRPAPGSLWPPRDAVAWSKANLGFDRERGWSGSTEPWPIEIDELTFELRAATGGQVGLFPEQLVLLPWLRDQVSGTATSVLNLFAYTGLATLALAQTGAAVAHVDASKPAVAWARLNARMSGLADRPIRWLVDDALGFVRREARRGRRYGGVILDPPTYGHAGRTIWKLEDDLPPLLEAIGEVLEPSGFVLLTSHTPDFGADELAAELELAFERESVEMGELTIESRTGAHLELGAYAIFGR
jgi:23S rRNA (cytosine1962-C5)-methyltransferase